VFDADMIMINMSVWDRRPAGRRGEYRRSGGTRGDDR
jgi:hypothetical protein